MYKIENQCCDCATPTYPCIGNACGLRAVKVFYCDNCGFEATTIVEAHGQELCFDCANQETGN